MQSNRRRDTIPELKIRSLLHRRGHRYRVDLPIRVPGSRLIRPDIVFLRLKVAVFIDGCFWHGCPVHGTLPKKTNRDYWVGKIEENRARDSRHRQVLEAGGWTVLRFWEHEGPESVVETVEATLAENGGV